MARGLAAGGNLDIDDKYHLSCRIIALLTTWVSLLQLVLGTVQVFTDEVFSVDRYKPPFSPGGPTLRSIAATALSAMAGRAVCAYLP